MVLLQDQDGNRKLKKGKNLRKRMKVDELDFPDFDDTDEKDAEESPKPKRRRKNVSQSPSY